MIISLTLPAFLAGLLTFLAPCTLPLVPGYLGFISGVSIEALMDPQKAQKARPKVFLNGLMYVVGFSAVFILLGSLFGLGGAALLKYRIWLSRLGGAVVIFFGLYLLRLLPFGIYNFLSYEKRFFSNIRPGNVFSSFLFGVTFAFGWTPCIGPILGSILLLASTSETVGGGAFLLFIFSLGLAVPFLFVALMTDEALRYLKGFGKYLNIISKFSGAFLVFMGILLLTNKFGFWLTYAYRIFNFINYDRLLNHL